MALFGKKEQSQEETATHTTVGQGPSVKWEISCHAAEGRGWGAAPFAADASAAPRRAAAACARPARGPPADLVCHVKLLFRELF